MASVEKIVERMRAHPANIGFAELRKVCEAFFGAARQSGSSHMIYKTPWPGDPRVNIQNAAGKAKAYQVRQVLLAIDTLQRQKRGGNEG
ncbi:MAG: toxin HicA [Burkholderiales bacterium]|nr:toxin HicA [Burkholderiales bacterium]